MSDRLLSEQKIYEIIARTDIAKFQTGGIVWPLFEAQDIKTAAAVNAEWVEWIEKFRPATGYKKEVAVIMSEKQLKERKRSIGL